MLKSGSGKPSAARENPQKYLPPYGGLLVEILAENFRKKERGRTRALRRNAANRKSVRLLFLLHSYLDVRADLAEELDRNLIFTDSLDGIRQGDLALFDGVSLRGESLRDIGGSD